MAYCSTSYKFSLEYIYHSFNFMDYFCFKLSLIGETLALFLVPLTWISSSSSLSWIVMSPWFSVECSFWLRNLSHVFWFFELRNVVNIIYLKSNMSRRLKIMLKLQFQVHVPACQTYEQGHNLLFLFWTIFVNLGSFLYLNFKANKELNEIWQK